MHPDKLRSAINVSNIQNVVANKRIRNNTNFFINPNGESYYIFEDNRIEEKEFERMFPTDLKPLNLKGKNSDRTKNWMHGEKSY